MISSQKILTISLFAGIVYFVSVSIAHLLGVKIPGLFIYYNIPSHHYQDQIISFLAFGWAAFFYVATKVTEAILPLLIAGFVALIGLININATTDFVAITEGAITRPFWIQTGVLGIYVAWLSFFFYKSKH